MWLRMQLNHVRSSDKANGFERSAFAKACSSFLGVELQIPRAKSVVAQIARMVWPKIALYRIPAQVYSLIIHTASWPVERYH
jgi:hypothetical protein